MSPGSLFVGTSGFAFPEWKGAFYPAGLKDREMLSYYAGRFGSVEINYTFRRDPSPKAIDGWVAATPDEFRFVLKAKQNITHFRRLTDPEPALAFLKAAEPLGERLGPILFQCPPNMKREPGRLEAFLDALPATNRYAFEFRHPSWDDDREFLAERGAAWVISETDEHPWPEGEALDARGFAYLRLRKSTYEPPEIGAWGARLRAALDQGSDVFCFVKHEEDAAGPSLALSFADAAR